MNAKEIVQLIKQMFVRELTPSEKIMLAEEKPMHRLLRRRWDHFRGTSIQNKATQEEMWAHITSKCWKKEQPTITPKRKYALQIAVSVAAVCLLIIIGKWTITNHSTHFETIVVGPVDQRMAVTLPDSSIIWLAAGSKLSYQEDFLENRKVLLDGEASFDIRHKMSSPFQAHIHDAFIEVKGTEFKIKSDNKQVEVTLYSGSIDFYVAGRMTKEVQPSEHITYHLASKEIKSEFLDIQDYDWRTEEFHFVDKPLSELANFVNRFYQTHVRFENVKSKDYLFTGSIRKNESLETVLRKICISFELTQTVDKDTIILCATHQ